MSDRERRKNKGKNNLVQGKPNVDCKYRRCTTLKGLDILIPTLIIRKTDFNQSWYQSIMIWLIVKQDSRTHVSCTTCAIGLHRHFELTGKSNSSRTNKATFSRHSLLGAGAGSASDVGDGESQGEKREDTKWLNLNAKVNKGRKESLSNK